MITCPCCKHEFEYELEEWVEEKFQCPHCYEPLKAIMIADETFVEKECTEHKLMLMIDKGRQNYTLMCSECYHVECGKYDKLIITGESEESK